MPAFLTCFVLGLFGLHVTFWPVFLAILVIRLIIPTGGNQK